MALWHLIDYAGKKNIITQIQKKEFQSMLSTFSHEIRNPLALITSEMQMLSDSQPQLCFNEHWDNIMENLTYIRELLDELSRYQNAGHITLVQTDLVSAWIELPVPFDRHWTTLESPLRLTSPVIFPRSVWIRQKSVRLVFNLLRNAQESIQHTHGKIRFFRFCRSGRCPDHHLG